MDTGKIWKMEKVLKNLSQTWKIENFEKMVNFVVILNLNFVKKNVFCLFNTHLVLEACYMAP